MWVLKTNTSYLINRIVKVHFKIAGINLFILLYTLYLQTTQHSFYNEFATGTIAFALFLVSNLLMCGVYYLLSDQTHLSVFSKVVGKVYYFKELYQLVRIAYLGVFSVVFILSSYGIVFSGDTDNRGERLIDFVYAVISTYLVYQQYKLSGILRPMNNLLLSDMPYEQLRATLMSLGYWFLNDFHRQEHTYQSFKNL